MSAVEVFGKADRNTKWFFMCLKWNGKSTLRTSVNLLGNMGNGGLRYISPVLYHPFATIIIRRQPHRVWPCRWASRDRPHLSHWGWHQGRGNHPPTHTHNVGHHNTHLLVDFLVTWADKACKLDKWHCQSWHLADKSKSTLEFIIGALNIVFLARTMLIKKSQ